MFIFRKQFYYVASSLKIIGHGNPDNNLESSCRSERRAYVDYVSLLWSLTVRSVEWQGRWQNLKLSMQRLEKGSGAVLQNLYPWKDDSLYLTSYTIPCALVQDMSRDSVVGIATSYGLDDRGVGVRVPVGSIIFSSPDRPDRLRCTQPPIQWVPGAFSPGVKRPGREVDHSPPTSAEVKKMWFYTSTPPYAFMA
jgi:hypothetical protein